MTILYLLRHAESIANEKGILAGRSSVGLSETGVLQAKRLVKPLSEINIDQVISSPIPRCIETITPLLKSQSELRNRFEVWPEFQEMDYGDWSGKRLRRLAMKRDWRTIQKSPEKFRFPGGESFIEAANRIENGMKTIRKRYPRQKVLLITHGDIVKMAINSTLKGEFQAFQRIVIDPASVSALNLDKNSALLFSNRSFIVKSESALSLKARLTLGGGTNNG
jgi:probable phosphoglycerate mutase